MSDRLAPDPIPRRDFIGMAGLWTTGVAILGSILGMARLTKPIVTPEKSGIFRIGRATEYSTGTTKLLAEQKVLIVSKQEGIAAISMICTHLGCVVQESDIGFNCPCHGSVFDKSGGVIGGPAPRGLRWLEVNQAVDGTLIVNSKKEVRTGTYYKS